jgi:hypothetical protein
MEKAKSLPVGRLFCVRTGPSFGSLSLVVVSSLARCSLSFWLVFGSSSARFWLVFGSSLARLWLVFGSSWLVLARLWLVFGFLPLTELF